MGETRVICTASAQEGVPRWLAGSGRGWVTAEYGMLPASTGERKQRDISRGRADGRTVEIQRLIGRSLRGVVDFAALGERTIYIDCDVLQADGGTRCASITGGMVALELAIRALIAEGRIERSPLTGTVAAVSCGIVAGVPLLDLDYSEDSTAEVDANVVMTGAGGLVEVQATAERTPLSRAHLDDLLRWRPAVSSRCARPGSGGSSPADARLLAAMPGSCSRAATRTSSPRCAGCSRRPGSRSSRSRMASSCRRRMATATRRTRCQRREPRPRRSGGRRSPTTRESRRWRSGAHPGSARLAMPGTGERQENLES